MSTTRDQSVSSQQSTETGSWGVDLTATTAAFTVAELGGLMTVRGSVPVTSAALGFDATGLLSWVTAELDPTGVQTGNPKRDKDLQGPKFFAADQHPTWVFRGGRAYPFEGGWTVNGRLTVRETVDLVLEVRPAADDATDGDSRVLTATAELDRRDAGLLKAPGAVIGHRIRIALTITLRRIG
jgi:polyisoprenoid-binding protein YceI